MLELFTNPGYLAAGGALISAPIIIHLINRMRFKRLRWAAMEFLLKAQKRSRRRLIIEQLILLLLRCLLVALAALLVLRFLGFSLAGILQGQEVLHFVILDDTLSMRDQFRDREGDEPHDCFKIAKDHLINDVVRGISRSNASERLVILQLSTLPSDPQKAKVFEPKMYQRINDTKIAAELKEDIAAMKPSKAHVSILRGIRLAQEYRGKFADSKMYVHLLGDYRKLDWTGSDAQEIQQALVSLDKADVIIDPRDMAKPFRIKGEGGTPRSNDNVGILDFRSNTRITGPGTPIKFTVTVGNFSLLEKTVHVGIYDDESGKEMLQVSFNEPMPLRVPANGSTTATFELPAPAHEFKDDQPYYAKLSARLENVNRGPLENDGLPDDNIRHVSVEVRKKVAVLLIDGSGEEGVKTGDSYFIARAIFSVPGGNYEVDHGHKLSGGAAMEALDRLDLHKYPNIIFLNVPDLTPKQLENLEKYVAAGGGLAFFMGPRVIADFYNDKLYNNGKGLFPVQLAGDTQPVLGKPALDPEWTGRHQLLLRDDQYPNEKLPIFGDVFKEPRLRNFLNFMFVKRHWPALPLEGEPGRVRMLANLPNEKQATVYSKDFEDLAQELALLDNEDLKEYRPAFLRHHKLLLKGVHPQSQNKAYQLASVLDNLLNDRGNDNNRAEFPDLTKFWDLADRDNQIARLRKTVLDLRERVLYSDPMILTSLYGQGRVVAVMTTAGKAWNNWGGGEGVSKIYPSILWEMQNFLSRGGGGDGGLTVGTPIPLVVDLKRIDHQGRKLKAVRTQYKPRLGQEMEIKTDSEQFGEEDKNNPDLLKFHFERTPEPGLYVTKLVFADAENEPPLFTWSHVFNVDTKREGNLQRVSQEDMEAYYLRLLTKAGAFYGPLGDSPVVNRQSDLSESPWFFLFFLGILVAEQALAVHLSFHLKGSEAELPAQVVQPHARAA